MKHLFSILIFSVCTLLFISCNSSSKSNPDETYEYIEETVELNDFLKQRIGDWAEEGLICYGVVVLVDSDGTIILLDHFTDSRVFNSKNNFSLAG